VPLSARCNASRECYDASDETNCSKLVVVFYSRYRKNDPYCAFIIFVTVTNFFEANIFFCILEFTDFLLFRLRNLQLSSATHIRQKDPRKTRVHKITSN